MGIGRPMTQPPEFYVLTPFTPEESRQLAAIIRRGCEAVKAVMGEGVESAMNRFNAPTCDLNKAEAE